MDIWTAVRTVLQKNPGIRPKYLMKELREKTGLSRSTIYEHLSSFVLREEIYREKGGYWLEKPQIPSKKELERIRNEIDKIKEDYVKGSRYHAVDRMYLLWGTLPKHWQQELELLIPESEKERFSFANFPAASLIIPQFLAKLHQMVENL